MKQFKIDLSEYNVEVTANTKLGDGTVKLVTEEIPYPMKQNIYHWLRLPGMFKGGVEICDACDLAKNIRNASDAIVINETELRLLTTAMDILIAQKSDPDKGVQSLGGEIHEECIRRVFKAEKV